MSSLRKSEISAQLNDWLYTGRYNPPKEFRGNEKAEKAEIEALMGILLKYAPQNEPRGFVSRVLTQLEYQLKFRIWPNVQELGAVCVNIVKAEPKGERASLGPEMDMRDIAVSARKMKRNEPVGEGYLWGRQAVEMIGDGLIDRDTMDRYRRGAFWSRVGSHHSTPQAREEAIAAARQWEDGAKARHAAAKAGWKAESAQHDVSMPDLRPDYTPNAAA